MLAQSHDDAIPQPPLINRFSDMLQLAAAALVKMGAGGRYVVRSARQDHASCINQVAWHSAGNIQRAAIGTMRDAVAYRPQMINRQQRGGQRPSSNSIEMDAERPT
jgi:hypothetical protein